MIGKAYLKGGAIHLQFEFPSMGSVTELEAPLGTALTNFTWLAKETVVCFFSDMKSAFLKWGEESGDPAQLNGVLNPFMRDAMRENLYFVFYVQAFLQFLVRTWANNSERWECLREFLLDGGAGINTQAAEALILADAAAWCADVLADDLRERQKRVREDLDVIADEGGKLGAFSAMQRLYLLTLQGRNYLSGEFRISYTPNVANLSQMEPEKMMPTLLENRVDIVEMTEIESLDGLTRYELFHTLKENLPIRRCKYCGEYFIPYGRVDTEYCNRIKHGETKRCSQIGAARNYWESKEGNPVFAEFQKAYKRNHSRQRSGKMTQTEFYEWSEEARRKRDDCEAGRLPLAEFKEWLGNRK